MGSAHGERGLEVVETARGGDTLIQHGVDSNLYSFPTHDGPSRLLDRLVGHYQLAPGGMHEESGVCQWLLELYWGDNRDTLESEDDWHVLEAKGVWIQHEMDDCNTSRVEVRHAFPPSRVGGGLR
jgi:hypothetical protein